MILQKGANAYLQHANDVQVKLYWEGSPSNVSPYCLLLDHDCIHKVIDGQEENPYVPFIQTGENQIQYNMNLNELPPAITQIVFAIVVKGSQPIRKMGLSIEKRESVQFELSNPSIDSTVVLGEIYRYKTGWKVRAVGEGVKGDKKDLLQLYRYSNSDIERESIPKIVTVIDASIHTQPYFESGQLQKLFKDIFIASSTIHSTGEMDVYFFAVLHKRSEKATKENFQSYIEDFYPNPNYFNGLGLENQEIPVIDDLLEEYRDSETIFFLITSGDFPDSESLFERINYASQSYFWEMVVLNEEVEMGTKYNARNIKIVPFKTLNGLNRGDLHQTILQPINIWRNRDKL